jgi:hypothetical protein
VLGEALSDGPVDGGVEALGGRLPDGLGDAESVGPTVPVGDPLGAGEQDVSSRPAGDPDGPGPVAPTSATSATTATGTVSTGSHLAARAGRFPAGPDGACMMVSPLAKTHRVIAPVPMVIYRKPRFLPI